MLHERLGVRDIIGKEAKEKNMAVCRFFCKITNLKKLLDRKFHIGRIDLYTVHKNVASNLQQIRDTAKEY
jgi:hypothetical protein